MEQNNFHKGIDSVTIPAVEHDIVPTKDIIFDYFMSVMKSPVPKLNDRTGFFRWRSHVSLAGKK